MNSYIINDKTLAIIKIEENICKVIEEDCEFFCNLSLDALINNSCLYYGSSFQGRIDASKIILNKEYKVPVVVREYDRLIFFPVGVKSINKCMWISLKKLKNYIVSKDKIEFIFSKNKSLFMDIKVESFESQLLKAYNLEKHVFFRSKI